MKFYQNLEEAMQNLTKRGAFLTVKSREGAVNTMTISWGYIGFSWNKPYFVAMVRPQRYTHEIIGNADSYTISIPYSDDMKHSLGVCGSKSGRDVDKEEAASIEFIQAKNVDSPVVDNCGMYYECKLTYVDTIKTDNLPKELKEKNYNDDTHNLYYGEIVEAYTK